MKRKRSISHADASHTAEKNQQPDSREVSHMIYFFMCQLREEYGRLIGPHEDFDSELCRIDSSGDGHNVRRACEEFMPRFFSHAAKGSPSRTSTLGRYAAFRRSTCRR